MSNAINLVKKEAETLAILKEASIKAKQNPRLYQEDDDAAFQLVINCIQAYCESELAVLCDPTNDYKIHLKEVKTFTQESFSEWVISDQYEDLLEDFFGNTYLGSKGYADNKASAEGIFNYLETVREFLGLMCSFKPGGTLPLDEIQDFICYSANRYGNFSDAWEMSKWDMRRYPDDPHDEFVFRAICNAFYVLGR